MENYKYHLLLFKNNIWNEEGIYNSLDEAESKLFEYYNNSIFSLAEMCISEVESETMV